MPLVIIRHLKGSRPVTHAVITENDPTYKGIDWESYSRETAAQEIVNFKEKFVEFKEAEFYMDYIPHRDVMIIY